MPKGKIHANFRNIGGVVNNRDEFDASPNQLLYAQNIFFDKLGSLTTRPSIKKLNVFTGSGVKDSIEYISSDGKIRTGTIDFT